MMALIQPIGKVLGLLMQLCFHLTGSYGLSIILFTLLTKCILFPVNILTQKNSIKMVQLMPEENALRIKYIDDKDKLADERLALYKRYHYNPLVSMIPLLIQIPMVLGLVYVVYHPFQSVLNFSGTTSDALRSWLEGFGGQVGENAYQLEIIRRIKEGASPDGAALADAVSAIRGLNMHFLGLDLTQKPGLANPALLLIPLLAGLSAWLMCAVQNKVNILQMTQGKAAKWGTAIFLIAFSLYFAFLVPGGVGLYWIFSNLFSIPFMLLVNLVIPPKKYVDYAYLKEMETQRIRKEAQYKKYRSREKADYKRFFAVENMKLMVYSEQGGFYKYFAGMIDYICAHSDIPIHYVTSDPNDPIFNDPREQIHTYYIASDSRLIPLFMKLNCDMCIMTMPDLEKYHIKRSRVRKDIEYVQVSHGMNSLALTFRKGALDYYDTIFCPGVHTFNEIRESEALYGTPRKRLVEAGYPLIDKMLEEYNAAEHPKNDPPRILIAPSWQPDNLIDLCGEKLIEALIPTGYQIILRPHPQHVRHEPEKFEQLKARFQDSPNVEIQTDFTSNSPVMEADLLITDWSGICWEYAFVTLRPVLFIDTPMKIMNPEYDRIETKPINITLRNVIGKSVSPDDLTQVRQIAEDMLTRREEYRDIIEKTRGECIYNLGKSAALCGRYVIKSLTGKL